MAAQPSSTATSTTTDGPVLSVITKRLRALRKKHNRIIQMEESLSQGKTLNKEQQDVLRSKPAVLTLIDELEKLRQPLAAALDEELTLALEKTQQPPSQPSQQHHQHQDDAVTVPDNNNNNDSIDVENGDRGDVDVNDVVEVVKDVLNLMYFGSLFDVKQQSDFASLVFTRTLERGVCLSYDYVADDATDMLSEMDLDLISSLQGLMISRSPNSSLSHQNALDHCVEHAKRWLQNSHQPIYPNSNVTYATLREKLKKIMASGYVTATPQMKGPGEVAAAVAVGNFGSFNVPMQETVVNVEVPVQVEGSSEQYQDQEENAANYEEYETVERQSGNAEEFHKDELESENSPEVISVQTDQEQFQNEEGEYGYRNADFKDQQYVHRRGQRGGRGGGGRRGYSSGRGGRGSSRGRGPYQNGRSEYYDNYYPRNNYYNRRGGRGGSGGGGESYLPRNNPYKISSGAPVNHNQANNGAAS